MVFCRVDKQELYQGSWTDRFGAFLEYESRPNETTHLVKI